MRNLVLAMFGALSLAGCGSKTACYAMSDEDATQKVVAEYAKQPVSTKGDPAQMQFSGSRVVGVGRSAGARGDGKALTQVWFMQDDHTLTVATLTEACDLQFRSGLAADAIKQAVIPTKPPNF